MLNRNEDIKKLKGDIPFWLLAEKVGCHESTLLRWMRFKMPDDKRALILRAIQEIKVELQKEESCEKSISS